MPLTSGTRLGAFEILAPLGAGGMGEVYRARDTRLDRTVALKVLPAHIAGDPEFRQRFEREARTISQLNHPHICTLHDVGEQDGRTFLVLEYLEGETLADRLKNGPLPVQQALGYAIQIADALDKAHRQGIVHRDLKPGNIFLVRSGGASGAAVAKLLDFGLAKSGAGRSALGAGTAVGTNLTAPPTVTTPLTAQGTVLGTFQYMAPEQIEGQEADERTEIFAFGCVLYEMVTGSKAFEGKTQASLMAAILERQPSDVAELKPDTPPVIDRLVRTCLAKNPDERWQSARDLLRACQWAAEDVARAGRPGAVERPRRRGERLLWTAGPVVAVALAAGVTGSLLGVRGAPPATPVRFEVFPPTGFSLTPTEAVGAPHLALSPDGRRLALAITASGQPSMLSVRTLDSVDAQIVSGTEDGSFPFWSPDSASVAFFAQGRLRRVDLASGVVQALAAAPQGRGGTWSADGVIVFAPNINDPLHRVSASGGVPVPLTRLDAGRRETSHRWPHFLPDGRHIVYFARTADPSQAGIALTAVDSGDSTFVLPTQENVVYAEPGYLLAVRDGTLMAHALDVRNRRVSGEPRLVLERVPYTPDFNYAALAISGTGVLAYGSENITPNTAPTWFDRAGNALGSVGPPGAYSNPALSPNGRRVAAARFDPQRGARDIWIFDSASRDGVRFTFDPADDAEPLWSSDGSVVVYRSNREGHGDLFRKLASGAGSEESFFKAPTGVFPTDWSRDGRLLVYQSPGATTGWDLWTLHVDSGDAGVFLRTPANEMHGRLSPDGRWMVYSSDESGRREIYVQPFPPTGAKWQVSVDGGAEPHWRADGRELFFVGADRQLMAAGVKGSEAFEAERPIPLFPLRTPTMTASFGSSYAVSPDGERFLVNTVADGIPSPPVIVAVDWLAEMLR